MIEHSQIFNCKSSLERHTVTLQSNVILELPSFVGLHQTSRTSPNKPGALKITSLIFFVTKSFIITCHNLLLRRSQAIAMDDLK